MYCGKVGGVVCVCVCVCVGGGGGGGGGGCLKIDWEYTTLLSKQNQATCTNLMEALSIENIFTG